MRPYGLRFRQREKTPRGAPPSLGPLCEGAPPAGGGGEKRGAGRNISGLDCQKTFVGASIARPCPLALQDNCPGKCVAAVSWRATNGRPYTRNRENVPLSAPTKNVGADSISARACLRQDKLPRAHIECAPTDYVSDKGRKLRAGHRPLRGDSAASKT